MSPWPAPCSPSAAPRDPRSSWPTNSSQAHSPAHCSHSRSPALVMGADHHDRWGCGHFILALDPAAFGGTDDFGKRADDLVRALRDAEPAKGVERVYLPGEREWLLSEDRRKSGLPMAPTTLQALDSVAQ